MKNLIVFFILVFISFSSYTQTQNLMGSVSINCNPPSSQNSSHSLVVPQNSKLVLTGDGIATGGPCTGTGSASITMFINVVAVYQDADGNSVNQSIGSTQGQPIVIPGIETGTLAAGITVVVNVSMTVVSGFGNIDYNLDASFVPLNYNDDPEPNNSFSEAIDTIEGAIYQGNGNMDVGSNPDNGEDWYKLTVPENGILKIFTNSDSLIPNGFNTSLSVYRSTNLGNIPPGTVGYGQATGTSNGSFITDVYCVKAGDIIYLKYQGSSSSYSFSWQINEPSGFVDAEPNDNEIEAITISENQTLTGNIGYGLTLVEDSAFSTLEDLEDWYSFTMPNSGDLDIDISSNNLGVLGMDLYLEDNGNLINLGLADGGIATPFTKECLPAGNYFFRIDTQPFGNSTNISCDTCCTTYQFTLDFQSEAQYAEQNEPNDTIVDAFFLTPDVLYDAQLGYFNPSSSTGIMDTIDMYVITSNSNGTISVTFTDPLPADAFVYLFRIDDAQQTVIGSVETNVNNEILGISIDCAAEGEEFILNIIAPPSSCMSYQFNYTTFFSDINTEIEPNDEFSDAQNLNADETVFGQVRYGDSNASSSDFFDYYYIPITGSAPIEFSFDLLNDGMTIQLVRGGNVVLETLTQNQTTGTINVLTYNNIESNEDYYLRLSANSCSDYYLNSWAQNFTADNDAEPNNTTTTAIPINFNEFNQGQLSYYSTGNDSQDYYTFTLNQADDVEFILNAYEGLNGTSTLIVLDDLGNQIYQLQHDGTNTSLTSNLINMTSGTYFVVIQNIVNETGSYSFNIIPQSELSNFDYSVLENSNIYPIPAEENITIVINDWLKNVSIKIFDITGKNLISGNLKEKDNNIDISNLSDGVYFVRLKYENEIFIKRIVKK